MFDSIFQWLYLIGLIGMETIRFPYRMQNKRDRRAGKIRKGNLGGSHHPQTFAEHLPFEEE